MPESQSDHWHPSNAISEWYVNPHQSSFWSSYIVPPFHYRFWSTEKNKPHGLSPQANYTDRATAAYQRSWCQPFADRGCHVVSVTNPYGRILGFLDRSRYYFFQVAPQLYSRGWVDPVPDPLPLRKPASARNRTRSSGSVARNSDH
jgi:hypothetical protein